MTIPNRISAISLFVDDIAASKAFYANLFGVSPINEDDVSVAFRFGETVINLLNRGSAEEIVAPDRVGARGEGSRFQLTVWLDDVDAVAAELRRRGIPSTVRSIGRGECARSTSSIRPATAGKRRTASRADAADTPRQFFFCARSSVSASTSDCVCA